MTLILDENLANANLILKFMGALDREDFLLCRNIKEEFEEKRKNNQLNNEDIESLKVFAKTCKEIVRVEICTNTINMLESLKC